MRSPIIIWFTLCCFVKVSLMTMYVLVCVIVNGRYQVEVRLFGYSNPTGRCQVCAVNNDGLHSCCDNQMTFGICNEFLQCDSFFTYCLRPLNTSSIEEDCSGFEKMTSTFNTNDGPVDFENSIVLGLPNPLLLPGLTDTYMGVQLYIEIMDRDVVSDPQLVDRFLINLTLAVGVEYPRQPYSGIHGFVTTELAINVSCVVNFQESDCSQCVPGFTGPDCEQIDDCIGVNCNGNGQCVDAVNSFNCNCDPGFTGVLCQTNIDECITVNCSGNGQCVDGVDSFSCNCSVGYTGTHCEVNIDDCVGVSCSGNGECLDGVNSFTCECSPGYSGPLCDTIVIEGNLPTGSDIGGIIGGVLGAALAITIIIVLLVVVVVAIVQKQKRKQAEEKFHLQTNELYGVCMATKCQGAQERIFTHRYDDLQEGKERREMSSEQSGQTQLQFGSKDLELKSNEAYSAFQITTVDNEVHGQIATKIVCHHNA